MSTRDALRRLRYYRGKQHEKGSRSSAYRRQRHSKSQPGTVIPRRAFVIPAWLIFSDITDKADDDLFREILSRVLAPLQPDKTEPYYNLRSVRAV